MNKYSGMHLGLFGQGTGLHVGGWRMPESESTSMDFDHITKMTLMAESACFDFIFFADAPYTAPTLYPGAVVRLEPLTLLTGLAVRTSRIGLIATASTTYSEPYNLARLFATLDHISGGRAGWNVVTGAQAGAAANFGHEAHPDHDTRYAIAAEYLEVFKGLLDSWEDGALVVDKVTGKYVDFDRMHVLNHRGKYFSVAGPLNITRAPQGYPVIVQSGASEAGREFAADTAEVIFTVQQELEGATEFAEDMHRRMEKNGRNPDHLKILPGVVPIIGESLADAKAKLKQIGELADPDVAMRALSDRIGEDMRSYPLDEPIPELPVSKIMRGHAAVLRKVARDNAMTLRELRDFAAGSLGHRMLLGRPEDIADGLEEWFAAGAAHGYVIMPLWQTQPLAEFIDEVVPILRKRGLFREEYSGATLRDHLGLPRADHPRQMDCAKRA